MYLYLTLLQAHGFSNSAKASAAAAGDEVMRANSIIRWSVAMTTSFQITQSGGSFGTID